jgi:OPT family oligopeptide transporter
MITHVFLWHRKEVYQALRYPNHEDIHNRLMRAYPTVPKSWYMMTLAISLSSAVLLVFFSPLQLPVWGLLLAVLISLLFLIPVGIIKAVSDTGIGLNVITEFVAGVLLPGRPIANVVFKCYGYMAMSQALDLTTDMKLAHYMKIPPKAMFLSQLMGTIIGCVVNLAVIRLVLNPSAGYRGFIDGTVIDPTAQWDGRKIKIFYSASIIWGAIGPMEFFSGPYRRLYWGFLIGFLMPVIPWLLNKRWPRKYWSLINFPVLLHGAGAPPQVPTNVSPRE